MTASKTKPPLKVFYSYASSDEPSLRALETSLALLKREGLIESWGFRQITPGTEWKEEIDRRISEASIVLFLISRRFLASEYCMSVEAEQAFARRKSDGVVVIPIILEDCDWRNVVQLADLQVLPPNARPLNRWGKRATAWQQVVEGIRQAVLTIDGGVPKRTATRAKAARARTPSAGTKRGRTRTLAPSDITPLVRRFIGTFPPPFLKVKRSTVLELRGVIRARRALPPIFYRWCARDAVHWVDFSHFLLFRRLADLGFRFEFLIDVDREFPRERVGPPTERVVRAMFAPHEAACHWYSDIHEHRWKYSEYAQKHGFDYFVAEEVARASSVRGDTLAQVWLEFLTYSVRRSRRCIIYATDRRLRAYDALRGVDMHFAMIVRPFYYLGRRPGKEGQGKNLVVEPPHYTAILSWLERAAPADVRTLAQYLTLNDSETAPAEDASVLDRAAALLKRHPGIGRQCAANRDFARGAFALLASMLDWNERFFATAGGRREASA